MIKVKNLSVEFLREPIGIDAKFPRLSWEIESDQRNVMQTAYRILVASNKKLLSDGKADMWDSGYVVSSQSNNVTYEGRPLKTGERAFFKIAVKTNIGEAESEPSFWEAGVVDDGFWQAQWIYLDPKLNPKPENTPADVGAPSPYFRKSFASDKKAVKARLYATALGVYECYINGRKVGDLELAPGCCDFFKRAYYQTFDVTDMLVRGENVIGAVLGDGWFCGCLATVGRAQYGEFPYFFAQLVIDYDDGSRQIIATDGTWKASNGDIIYSDLLMGQFVDGRIDMSDFARAGYDDSAWSRALTAQPFKGRLWAQIDGGAKVIKELKPILRSIDKNGFYIFDMGQNMVGRVRIKVKGSAGTVIRLRFGEMLCQDGTLYTENLRTATQTDYYVLSGKGEEVFEPRFTFHGFRYVEVHGYPGEPSLDCITGVVVSSALVETGRFESSHQMLNKLYSNIVWGQRGNFLSIPTDCPQRDERLGWTGDAQIFARTACFNVQSDAFLTKYLYDVTDAQKENGAYTDVAPMVKTKEGTDLVGNGTAAWGDAGVIIPWTLYLCYNDKRVIETNYDAMTRWIDYLKASSENLIRHVYTYGDWLNVDDPTPGETLSTAFFAYSTKLLAKMAAIIGRDEDSKRFNALFEDIKAAFNKAFVKEDGTIHGDTQTCYVMALKFGLVDGEMKKIAAQKLAQKLDERGGNLSTGFVGVGYLLDVLVDSGYTDKAFGVLMKDTYPSWFYSIKNGATTVWERWNSYTAEEGFGDPAMNSFNHYSLGSVGQWMYRYCAGIDTDETERGYDKIIMRPHAGGGLEWVKAEYHSIKGLIKAHWRLSGDVFEYDVTIPANCMAEIYLPCDDPASVTESGRKLDSYEIVNGRVAVKVGSGSYKYVVNKYKA